MESRYAIKEGKYVFYLDGKPMFETENVALLIGERPSFLVMHGPPAKVHALEAELTKYSQMSRVFGVEPPKYHSIEGRFDVQNLNLVLAASFEGQPFSNELLVSAATT